MFAEAVRPGSGARFARYAAISTCIGSIHRGDLANRSIGSTHRDGTHGMQRSGRQGKRGAQPVRRLELAVLGLLRRTPMHGYELRKQLTSVLGLFRALSYGSLYPCLHELLAAGLIAEEHDEAGPDRPPARPRGRPPVTEGVPADGRRQGTAAGAPRRGGARGVGGRRVRGSLRVFRADEGRREAPDPGGPAQPARGAHGGHPRGPHANQGARGQLHPGTAPTWPGVSGTGSPVAERADRFGAAGRRTRGNTSEKESS